MLITKVRLDQVQPHPHNIRREVGDVAELVESFKASGMLQPIVVAPATVRKTGRFKTPEGADAYTLIAGHRRLAAAKACEWSEIDAIVRDDLDTEAKQIETMAIENLQRVNLTPAEEARGYQQLLDLGYTPQKIAKQTGRNLKTIKLRIGLTRLSPKATDKLHTGQITLEQAEVLASFAKDPTAYAELEKTIGTNNFAYRVQAVKDKQAKDAKRQKLFEQLRAEGVKRIDPPRSYPWDSVVQPLTKLSIEPEDHTECIGHAALVVDGYPGSRIEYVCMDPVGMGHTKAPKTAASGLRREDPAKQREVEERHENLRIAEVTRTEFIKDKLRHHRLTQATIAAVLHATVRMIIDEIFEYCEPTKFVEILGIDEELDGEAQLDELDKQLARADGDVQELACLVFAGIFALNDPGVSNFGNKPSRAVIEALRSAGYPLADVEQAELKRTSPSGTCRGCGCTDEDGCDPACSWANEDHTLCTACV